MTDPESDMVWQDDWMAATSAGLFRGRPGMPWELAGPYAFHFTCMCRRHQGLVAGTQGGLWEVRPGQHLWRQMHDELLTVVQGVAVVPGDPGLVAATLYGLHTARRGESGALRWQNRSDGLEVDGRAGLCLLVDPTDNTRWIVGTEAGVLVAEDGGARWVHSDLLGTAARALLYSGGRFWAGTDARGICHSADALHWEVAGEPMSTPVLSLAAVADGRLLAGTGQGVIWGDGDGAWHRSGPRVWTTAVDAGADSTDVWVAGASLGGLWWTDDAGGAWHQVAGVPRTVEAVAAPLGRADR